MLGFFRTTEVFVFAGSIADEYDRLRRSVALRQDTPEKRQQKFEKLLEKIDAYSRNNRLNFYKKSRMLFAIKQGLVEKGIAEGDVDAFLNRLITKGLARR